MVDATLLQEDAWFRWHAGVNPISLMRAFVATYVRRSRRIGGSTITMQLARQRFGINSRTPIGKLEQMLRALQLDRDYTKDQLLEAYLNSVPYGGNIEGVGAASIIYFGKPAKDLSLAEALTLAVIPQHPEKRSPLRGSHPRELGEARLRLAHEWQKHHGNSVSGLSETLEVSMASRHELPFLAPHLVDRVLASGDSDARITTTVDSELQELIERRLKSYVERNRSLAIDNGAVILLDYRTMQVSAYVGSANYFSEAIDGQVDGLRGRRSPGSALKPFIYALAIDQGLIHPQTMLKDTALRIAAYNPENFDRDFLGPIDATSALVRSRNVPAIEVANMLRPPGLYGFLKAAGVQDLRDESFYGLALALGGLDITMEELAGLYAMLANGGVLQPIKLTTASSAIDRPEQDLGRAVDDPGSPRLLSPEASYLVLEMLRTNPRPSNDFTLSQVPTGPAIPWKTGTSYGFRDAWAIGVVGPYVLGVWIGNFDGTPNANFVGRDAAGPLFFDIVDALRARAPLEESIVHGPLNLKRLKVCALSGQLPGPYCARLKTTWFIPGKSPIATCQIHRAVAVNSRTGTRGCGDSTTPAEAGDYERGDSMTTQVYEFWPSDLEALFRTASVPRRTPPPSDPNCGDAGGHGFAPAITSPAHGIAYSIDQASAAVQVNAITKAKTSPETPATGASDAACNTEIPFTAVTDAESRVVYWFVDSAYAGTSRTGESLFWKARPGTFIVRAVDEQGRAAAATLTVIPAVK
jgi:penicillin-binding protein 1C